MLYNKRLPHNTADHLPIVSKLNVVSRKSQPTLDWNRASNDGSVSSYASQSNDLVKPLLVKDYSFIHELKLTFPMYPNPIIASVTIPNSRPPNQDIHRINDAHLSTLC